MTNPTVRGMFSFPYKDLSGHDVVVTLTISIEEVGTWDGQPAYVPIDGQFDAVTPLIICHKDDVIYLNISTSPSTYTPVITGVQKVSGDDVLVLRSGPAAVLRIADIIQQGNERFSILFDLGESENPSPRPFIVDPYISCN